MHSFVPVVLNPYAEEEQIPLEQTESKQDKPVQEAEDIAKQEPVSRPSPPNKRVIEKPAVPPLPASRTQTPAVSLSRKSLFFFGH